MRNFQKGFAWFPLLILATIIATGAGVYFAEHKKISPIVQNNYPNTSATTTKSVSIKNKTDTNQHAPQTSKPLLVDLPATAASTGSAPLSITFRTVTDVLYRKPDGGSYRIDYGDGRTSDDDALDACHLHQCDKSSYSDDKNPDQEHAYILHTYTEPGTYAVGLLYLSSCFADPLTCNHNWEIVGTTTVIVR